MPIFTIQTPEGRTLKIEAADEAGALAGAQEWSASQAKTPKRNAFGEVAGFMANVNRGLGVGDEMAAGFKTAGNVLSGKTPITNVGQDFKRSMAEQRQLEDSYARDRPVAAPLAKGTGNALTALVPAGRAANAFASGTRLANATRGATAAGLTAAGYAAADRGTMSERAQAAAEAARNPFVLGLGAAAGALGPATAKAKAPKRTPAPSLEDLTARKNAAYKAVEQSGEQFPPEAVTGFVDGLSQDMRAANLNPARHPKAASMLADIQDMRGQPMNLTQLDQLRQVIRRDVGNATDDAEKFMGRKMIDALDSFIDTSPAASRTVKTARGLNTQVRKIESINEAVDTATWRTGSTGSGGNIDNATRQELRKVFEKTPNFTPDERAALERIVMGSRGQNLLRQAGKLSPQGNGLMTALSIGGAAANPVLAIPTATGAVSKVVADAITQRRVRELVALIARGGEKAGPEVAAAQQELLQITGALSGPAAAKASRAAGVAGASASQRNAFAEPANP